MKSIIRWKRFCLLFIGAAVMCMLSACTFGGENTDGSPVQGQVSEGQHSEETAGLPQPTPKASEEPLQSIAEENSNQQETAPTEEENPALSSEESYKAVLLGKEDFINSSETGEILDVVNIRDIWKTFAASEMPSARVKQFAIVDMDGDGKKEIVLSNDTGATVEGFEILRFEDGKVYGYHFGLRALNCLKEDGTSTGSGGASDTTIKRILFLEKGYTIDALYESKPQYNSDEILYYANGEICSEEEFQEAIRRQDEKADAVWYELTPENVDLAFENRF